VRRRAIVASALLVAACHTTTHETEEARPDEVSASVSVAKVDRGDVERTITTFGTVEFAADRQRTLAFVKPGLVTDVPVVAGQTVKKGDVLLAVGGVPRGAPEVQQANIEVEFAERELARVKRLVDEKLATNQDLQNAEKQLAAAKAALHGLGGGGAGGGRMRASGDGIVAEVLVHRGDLVQAGQAGVVLAARDSMTVRAGFEVEDLPDLAQGLTARLRPVYGEKRDSEVISKLSTLHRVVNARTQLVEGLIHVDQPPAWLAAGLAVQVVVVLESHQHVLRVPRDALVQQGGKQGVFVVDKGHARFRAVKAGFGDDDRVEVDQSLAEGDRVVTTGRSSLSDGMAVRVPDASSP
jgi:RND family efflux transporter MFP subunit